MRTRDEVQDCVEFFNNANLVVLEEYSSETAESYNAEEKGDILLDKVFCPKFSSKYCASVSPCIAKGKRGIRFKFEDRIYFVYRTKSGFYAVPGMNYVPNSGVFLGRSKKEVANGLTELIRNSNTPLEERLLQGQIKA